MSSFICAICSSTSFESYQASEKMFGMGGKFIYQECQDCGVLKLKNIPENIDKYYPSDYYSLRPQGFIKKYMR